MKREPRDRREIRNAATLATGALTLATSVVVGVAMGYGLDRWLGTRWFVIVFAILGVIAGFVELIRAVVRAGENSDGPSDSDSRNDPGAPR